MKELAVQTSQKKEAKKSKSFTIFLCMLCILCALTTVGGLVKVYKMAVAYEGSVPQGCLAPIIELAEQKNWAELAKMSGLTLSPYETTEDIERAFSRQAGFTLEQVETQRISQTQYAFLAGAARLGTITLKKTENDGQYGFDHWTLERLELNLQPQPPLIIEAPEQAMLTVNGKKLQRDEKTKTGPVEEFGTLPETLTVQMLHYQLDGLLNPPKIQGDLNAQPAEISTSGGKKVVSCKPEDALIHSLQPMVEAATQKYAAFITKDATFEELSGYFLRGTKYYKYLSEFYNGWYIEHDGFSFQNMETGRWLTYNENALSCEISFDYIISKGWKTYTYPSSYIVYLVKTTEGWKISNMITQ